MPPLLATLHPRHFAIRVQRRSDPRPSFTIRACAHGARPSEIPMRYHHAPEWHVDCQNPGEEFWQSTAPGCVNMARRCAKLGGGVLRTYGECGRMKAPLKTCPLPGNLSSSEKYANLPEQLTAATRHLAEPGAGCPRQPIAALKKLVPFPETCPLPRNTRIRESTEHGAGSKNPAPRSKPPAPRSLPPP